MAKLLLMKDRKVLIISALVLVFSFAQSTSHARIWQLWGGKASIDLPSTHKLQQDGPFTYRVMALKQGFDATVITLLINKLPGSAKVPDWSSLVYSWQQSIKMTKPKVIIAPRGRGNVFEFEIAQLPMSHTKKMVIHGPRTKTDPRNLYDVTLVAVPSSSIGSATGKALLKSFKTFKVKP